MTNMAKPPEFHMSDCKMLEHLLRCILQVCDCALENICAVFVNKYKCVNVCR